MNRDIFVTVLTTSYPRTPADDAGIFLERLVKALEDQGVHGRVITPLDRAEPLHEQREKFTVVRYRYGIFLRGSLAYGAGILPNLKRAPLRIFQAPGLVLGMFFTAAKYRTETSVIHANWIISGIPAALAKLVYGIPYLITVRGEDIRLLKVPGLSLLLKAVLTYADRVVCVSTALRTALQENAQLSNTEITVIENGVNHPFVPPGRVEELRFTYKIESSRVLLYVGRLIPLKRIELLLEILARDPESTLLLVGAQVDTSYVQELKDKIEKKKLTDRVRFCGQISPADVPAFYELADYYCTASAREGRPNSVLEALASGTPVLASDIHAHRELITHNRNGYLFSENKIGSVVEWIQSQARDPKLYASTCANAEASVAEFRWESCATKYLALFGEITKRQ